MTARAEKREGDRILQDFVRYSLRAVRGLGTIAEEEARGLVRNMVDLKKITPEEGEKLLATLMLKMQQGKEVFQKRVEESVSKALEKLSSISSREIETLKDKIDSIDRRINNLVSKRDYRAQV